MDRNACGVMPVSLQAMSLSARRAWIEIVSAFDVLAVSASLSARRAWIEITVSTTIISTCTASLSARRAWIEISGALRATKN